MQKKIIALAIAGLASTAAFAQSNVTIYGSVDYGYAYRTDSMINGVSSQSALDGGITQGNRIGFKGVEDLGNGVKAVFLVEQGLGLDTTGTAASTVGTNKSINFTRQAYVGLTGGFGTVVGGRLYTPWHNFVSAIDPFASGTVGQYKNVSGSDVVGLFDPARVDNAVAYISPSFGGFSVTAAYSNNFSAQEDASFNSRNNTVYALLGQYSAGPVVAGLSYHYVAPQAAGAFAGVDNVQNATLGGTFDLTAVKLAAMYSWNNLDFEGAGDVTVQNYLLGVTVPIGKVSIKGSYVYSDGDFNQGVAQQFAIGANYALSKRTDLYTAYSYIDNDDNRGAVVGDASNSGLAFKQGFQMGVRHTF